MPQLVEPSDVRVYLGEVAVFECRLSNPPQEGAFNPNDDVIVIEWTKNDRPLASAGGSNSRIKVLPSGLLVVKDVTGSDRGEYRCQVKNRLDPFGSSQTSRGARLTVVPSQPTELAPPKFAVEPRNIKASGEGGTVTMDCAANGKPK